MNVEELIERLSELDRDAEVRLATQPGWPFEYSLAQVHQSVQVPEGALTHHCPARGCDFTLKDDDLGVELGEMGDWELECPQHGWRVADTQIAPDAETTAVVYLAEGGQIGYLPEPTRTELGW